MEKRPSFSEIKSFLEFSKYYWYREELQQICRQLGIDSTGMKLELNHNIEEFFKGNLIKKKNKPENAAKTPRAHAKKRDTPLGLDTGLIECGFCFSQKFRSFFAEKTGISNFKFNTDMVATAKKVKQDGDTSFTLDDMLDVFYGRKTYAKYDNSSLQWNKFVKDFCADPQAAQFSDKLKTAAILWSEVRNSTRPKVYDTSLLQEFAHLLYFRN